MSMGTSAKKSKITDELSAYFRNLEEDSRLRDAKERFSLAVRSKLFARPI